jgi:hypothetical protein
MNTQKIVLISALTALAVLALVFRVKDLKRLVTGSAL